MLYLYVVSDWLAPKRIQIIAQNRPGLITAVQRAISPVSFVLNGRYRLTRILVVLASISDGGRPRQPIWELTSSSNSIPIQGFLYGQPVPGMKLAPSAGNASPLAVDTTYRLFVEAGRAKGQVEFRTPPAANN